MGISIKPSNANFTFYGNTQIYRDGRFYDVLNDKDISQYSEIIVIKDYSELETYDSIRYPYKRRRILKRNLVWNAFKGTIPSKKKVAYKNPNLRGHHKYALDNLKLVPKYSKQARNNISKGAKRRRNRQFKKIIKLSKLGKTKKEVCEELEITHALLKKIVEENGKTLELLFEKAEFQRYILSKFFEGRDISYIATKKQTTSQEIYDALSGILGVEDIKGFAKKFKMTMKVLHDQGFEVEDIKEIVLEEYKVWKKI